MQWTWVRFAYLYKFLQCAVPEKAFPTFSPVRNGISASVDSIIILWKKQHIGFPDIGENLPNGR